MAYNFNEQLKDAEKEYSLGGDRFKLDEGNNKIRILSGAWPLASHFRGKKVKSATCYGEKKGCPFHGNNPKTEEPYSKPNFKWVLWIIDRFSGQVKLAFLPHTIMKVVGALQVSEEYSFNDLPMPYDITIVAKGAGTKEVEYSVLPSPKHIELTQSEKEDFESKKEVSEIVEKMKYKQKKANQEEGVDGIEFDSEEDDE